MLGKLVNFDNVLFVFLSSIEQHRNSMHTTYCMFFAEETCLLCIYIYTYMHALYIYMFGFCSTHSGQCHNATSFCHLHSESPLNDMFLTSFTKLFKERKNGKPNIQTSKHWCGQDTSQGRGVYLPVVMLNACHMHSIASIFHATNQPVSFAPVVALP